MKSLRFPRLIQITAVCVTTLLFQAGCKKDVVPQNDVPKIPSLTTSSVTNITATAAFSGGTVTQKGSSDITALGVCWSLSQNPDISANHTVEGIITDVFTSQLTNLVPNTPYYVRAYATNAAGTGYGNILSFTTSPVTCDNSVSYEGKTYQTVLINTQCWFAQNLNVGKRINGSRNQTDNDTIEKYCYNDQETNCNFYGGLYQWDETMQFITAPGTKGICPEGWHVPTDADWTTLIGYLGGDSVAGGKMKQAGLANWASPNTGATNSSGFTALGAGNHNNNGFESIMLFAYFWSSSQDIANPDYAWSLTPYSEGKDIYKGSGFKANGFSVRCIKN